MTSSRYMIRPCLNSDYWPPIHQTTNLRCIAAHESRCKSGPRWVWIFILSQVLALRTSSMVKGASMLVRSQFKKNLALTFPMISEKWSWIIPFFSHVQWPNHCYASTGVCDFFSTRINSSMGVFGVLISLFQVCNTSTLFFFSNTQEPPSSPPFSSAPFSLLLPLYLIVLSSQLVCSSTSACL